MQKFTFRCNLEPESDSRVAVPDESDGELVLSPGHDDWKLVPPLQGPIPAGMGEAELRYASRHHGQVILVTGEPLHPQVLHDEPGSEEPSWDMTETDPCSIGQFYRFTPMGECCNSLFGDWCLVPEGYRVVRGIVDKILWTALFQ